MACCRMVPFILALFAVISFRPCDCRVLELDDRFEAASKSGEWLVMFYAPWCGHCKQLEPTWMEVGNALEGLMPVHVARLDCTRFSSLSGKFNVRGFPTIKFLSGSTELEYRGARTKDDIIAFVEKCRGPKITELTAPGMVKAARLKHQVFFLYLGEEGTELHQQYTSIADRLFLSLNFYEARPNVLPEETGTPTILVFKDDTLFKMPLSAETTSLVQISSWMNSESVSDFAELTGTTYHELKATKKSFVVAVLPDNSQKGLQAMVKEVALSRDVLFHPNFVFCWVIGNEIVNRMTYATINPPNVVVFNPENYEYHVLHSDSPISASTRKAELTKFLTGIIEGKLTPLGGSGIIQETKRFISNAVGMLVNFFRDSPVMASLVIGVPTFVITFLCYCICTMEDVEEEAGTDSEYDDEEEEAERLPEYEVEGSEDGVRRRNVEADGGNEGVQNTVGESSESGETEKDK